MSIVTPRVFTIAPGSGFLQVLAQEILKGFPVLRNQDRPPLLQWTILLPTRRAVRELTNILVELSGSSALVMPRIKPIGDLDEDRLAGDDEQGDLPKAISRTGELFTLLALLDEWAKANPQIALAQEIRNSHVQSLGLATSLLKLFVQVETEETNFDKIEEAYDADLSEHRNAILSLIGLLKVALPQRLEIDRLMSPTERRNRLIRLEARRISDGVVRGPIIAAGSTGTIPATRALLKAISLHPHGAVILPGLDHAMGSDAWMAITPEHPQFSLKTLIGDLGLEREEVQTLASGPVTRNWLASELMRPSTTAEQWHQELKNKKDIMTDAVQNLHLVEAPDRHREARSIALILRQALETPGQNAVLITPDRDLAKRVKAEMLRWNIVIDDSAGEPLVQFGLASLTARLLDCVADNCTPASLLSLLSHSNCNLGLDRDLFLSRLHHLEIAVLRGYGSANGLEGLQSAFERALLARRKKQRSHALVAALRDEDWQAMQSFIYLIVAALKPLSQAQKSYFNTHLNLVTTCIEMLAPDADQALPENMAFVSIMVELQSESYRHPVDSFAAASVLVMHILRGESYRKTRDSHPRLAIYGVLEARLIPADVVILGALNEGKWPAQADPGPWLNRSMRTIFGMQQPEREIGVSAHDFTQGFGHAKVYLTWSRRIEGAPQIASRWILRLQTVIKVAGLDHAVCMDKTWGQLAAALDEPQTITPHSKPHPMPPVVARPNRFSVSTVEKLIRDPYAVYASKILCLEPLIALSQDADARLRGTLFHEAINLWNQQQAELLSDDPLKLLLESGRSVFAPLMSDPEIAAFWWPRFVRMAKWLASEEVELRHDITHVHSEIDGRAEFKLDAVEHVLTARADRMDILQNGRVRIIDYKSGSTPTNKQVNSGMSPQLPLEAAILNQGKFAELAGLHSDALVYLSISGKEDEGKILFVKALDGISITELGLKHFASLKKLIGDYRNAQQAYFPRAKMFSENEKSDFDHLSRFAEWILAGEAE